MCGGFAETDDEVPARWKECNDPRGRAGCVAIARLSASAALINGFARQETPIQEMKLVRDKGTGDSPTYTWTAPSETEVVTCALFGCPPLVQLSGSIDASGKATAEITNFEQCALRVSQFAPVVSSLTVPSLLLEGAEPSGRLWSSVQNRAFVEQCSDRNASGCPRNLIMLAVGCWAYGPTALIAASRLVDADPTELIDSDPWIVPEGGCADELAGRTCVTSPATATRPAQLGSCRGSTCAQRCVESADCCPPGTQDAGAEDAGADAADAGAGSDGCSQECLCPKSTAKRAGTPYVGQCGERGSDFPIDSMDCQFE